MKYSIGRERVSDAAATEKMLSSTQWEKRDCECNNRS